jgi:hypothetical protein
VRLSSLGTSATEWPIVPTPDDRWWLWSSRWNENWQFKPKSSEKTCPSAILYTINPTLPNLGSNPGLCRRVWAMARPILLRIFLTYTLLKLSHSSGSRVLAPRRGVSGLIPSDFMWDSRWINRKWNRLHSPSLCRFSRANNHSHHYFILIYHRPLRCTTALSRQHIITSSVFMLGTSFKSRRLTGYSVRKLSIFKLFNGASSI